MRSRSTPPRRPAPTEAPRTPEPPARVRGAATTHAEPPAGEAAPPRRRARRGGAVEPPAPNPLRDLPPATLASLAPEELYRREKSRRTRPVDSSVMDEARLALEEAMTFGGKKRGSGFTIGAAGRKPKPKRAADDFDLPEYRPGERAPGGGDADED